MAHYLIIGGSSGTGLKVVKDLLQEGHQIWAASRSEGGLEGLSGVHWQSFDVTDEEASLNDLPEVLDGLVYAPGTINLKPFHMLRERVFRDEMEVNFFGAVRSIQQSLPRLKNSEHASIVLYSTVAVQTGMPFHASISSSKGAIEGLTRSLAAEFAPKIRVNAIALSLVDTPLADRLLNNDKKREASSDRHPLKRVGSTEDSSAATRFLLGTDSSWISGQIMQVDGGMSALRPL
ncbi:SDR family oxidoreductase [Cryomorphaceae bacterium]|nr:SDR family oxidoreductase [Cryomorphaceae bacterium]